MAEHDALIVAARKALHEQSGEGMTRAELEGKLGVGTDAAQLILRRLSASGRLQVTWGRRLDITGRACKVPLYALVPDER